MPVTLDPDAAAVFKAFQEAGRPPYETVSPTEARELYLTRKGRELAKRLRQVIKEQDDDFFVMLSKEERSILIRLLRKVYETYIDTKPVAGD